MEVKITKEQIDIIDKLLEIEIDNQDPCIDKKGKKALMKELRKTSKLSEHWWYELMEIISGGLEELTDIEQQLIEPVFDSAQIDMMNDLNKL